MEMKLFRSFILILCIVILGSCATGERAIEKMTSEQLEFLMQKLNKIEPNMNEAEVSKILGTVYRGSGTKRPVWLGPKKEKSSQIAVYYKDGKIIKILWLELNNFFWRKDW